MKNFGLWYHFETGNLIRQHLDGHLGHGRDAIAAGGEGVEEEEEEEVWQAPVWVLDGAPGERLHDVARLHHCCSGCDGGSCRGLLQTPTTLSFLHHHVRLLSPGSDFNAYQCTRLYWVLIMITERSGWSPDVF
ncbi:hypothetical protein E2C01_000381 [Portunus trituberculatus]|uniref:Uncharacterized protein n=1 Tax=Portunus trituberculatus TaxID=210409 RepID=A0A5B7CGG4_PORTR|nr:hypothetical protein [Portunus trituberculatus]